MNSTQFSMATNAMPPDFETQLLNKVRKVLSDEANADAWQTHCTANQESLIHHFVTELRTRIQSYNANSFSDPDEIRVLRFLGDLREHVEADKRRQVRSPLSENLGCLSHQCVNYAIASRLPGVKWRDALIRLFEKGYVRDPAEFGTLRVATEEVVVDVLTDAGRAVVNRMSW